MKIIKSDGIDAVSFRVLAQKLGVTPMAVSYHVGSRDQMIADLIANAFAGIATEPPIGAPRQRLRYLLLRYCDVALANSNLIRCMLTDPAWITEDLTRLTDLVRSETQKINDGDEHDLMLNLVIDYVHGFVFSAVAAPAHIELTTEDCARSLDWFLGQVVSV